MDALQKMVSRRLNDRSHKRHSKRLVADDFQADGEVTNEEWDRFTSNFNPNFNMLNCEVSWGKDSSSSNSTSLDGIMTPSPNGSCASSDDSFSKNNIGHLNGVELPKKENSLQKMSATVRKKLNPFSNNHREIINNIEKEIDLNAKREDTRKTASEEKEKLAKDKFTRKKIDIMDVRILGRKRGNEKRQLLIDEMEED